MGLKSCKNLRLEFLKPFCYHKGRPIVKLEAMEINYMDRKIRFE